MKLHILAAAVALVIGGAGAIISNPEVGVALGISVFAGGLADVKRSRRQNLSVADDKE
ncbi:hypothetical protein ACIQTZ_19070 [Paenarthrobacter sp. NPDC090520]|uniref:hypothetical protein n=1 Tax=Paenarthrobacter sp. NPDC090520 TaxID=3364382 RepID=UPI00381D22C6